MIKVLIINSTLERSGLTNVIYNLVSCVDPKKFEVHILTLSAEPTNSRWQDFQSLSIQLHTLATSTKNRFFGFGKKLKSFVNQLNPNIIHTFSFRGNVFAPIILSKYKRITTLQADLVKNYQVDYGSFMGTLMAIFELNMARKAHYVTVCSLDLLAKYKKLTSALIYIPNGVNTTDFYQVDSSTKSQLRKDLGLPENRILYISTGLINKRKDPETVLKAFVGASTNDNFLLMVGDGPLLNQLKAEYAKSENIQFMGHVANVKQYLNVADVFISASKSEGLPNALLEAGFCGLHLILSDIPAHKNIFNEPNLGVEFFEPENSNQLVKLIEGKNIHAPRMEDEFTAIKMANSFQGLYVSVLNS